MSKRKICVFTGTRAEYGLLYWLMKEIQEDEGLVLQLLVSGMHLSPEFGLTFKQIEKDGFEISKKIEILLSSDSAIGISKSMGLGMISFAEVINELNPDLIVVLGDRFEAFALAAAATISRTPLAHIHGGETTEGLIDEPIRHSITKMAHLHFVATEEYRKRVVQLGEEPGRVFNTGTPGIDSIEKLDLLSKDDFEKSIDFNLGEKSVLITFHPVTLEFDSAEMQFKCLLLALDNYKDLNIIFTKPNADTNGRIIVKLIDEYVYENSQRACSFVSLGQLRYLSALKHVNFVLGNSSSGLIEVPTFGIPTIDIGDRQKGRLKADSVIHCSPNTEKIGKSIQKALSKEFKEKCHKVINPYGKGGASKRIVDILRNQNLDGIIKKKFYDI